MSKRLVMILAVAMVARALVVAGTEGFIPHNDAWDFDRNATAESRKPGCAEEPMEAR